MSGAYDDWVRQHDTLHDEDRRLIRAHVALLPWRPLISVLMPTYDTGEGLLRQAIASVEAQLYPHWELCIADDASAAPHVAAVLAAAAARDGRIRIARRSVNGHISAATNTALGLATGVFVALMDHDDILPERALYEVAVELGAHPDADVIYSDEDLIDLQGRRSNPYFKPAWSPELLTAHNVISHLGVYRRSLVEALGGVRLGFEGSQDWDLALRATAATTPDRVRHIPAVLYHWRRDPQATSFSQSWLERCEAAGRRAVEEWLLSEGVRGAEIAQARLVPMWTHVRYPLPDPLPLLSLIVLGADELALDTLRDGTDWPSDRLDLIAVASDDGAAARPGREALLNQGALAARGELLVLLDAPMQPEGPWWLRELAGLAWRAEVGVSGAKLLDAHGRVRHAGLVAGRPGAATLMPWTPDDAGYFGQYALSRALSAVGGGCMALRRAVWEEAGGLDETRCGTAADTALCQRVRDLGYRVVWTPEAALRDWDAAPPQEVGHDSAPDPYHNPNLRLTAPGLAVPAPPRRAAPWRRTVGGFRQNAI